MSITTGRDPTPAAKPRIAHLANQARRGIVTSPRLRAARLLWQTGPGLAIGVAAFVVAEGVLPNLALIAIGRAAGDIPAAVAHGLSSPSGHHLEVALAFGGACYGLSLLRGPIEDLLSTACSTRVSSSMQRRLAAAASSTSRTQPCSTGCP
jgi:ATP-binding cassette, subfamily B, bacterial